MRTVALAHLMVKLCLTLARDQAGMTQEWFRWRTGWKWRALCAAPELEVEGDDNEGDEQDLQGVEQQDTH
jgi:hypothetical protein